MYDGNSKSMLHVLCVYGVHAARCMKFVFCDKFYFNISVLSYNIFGRKWAQWPLFLCAPLIAYSVWYLHCLVPHWKVLIPILSISLFYSLISIFSLSLSLTSVFSTLMRIVCQYFAILLIFIKMLWCWFAHAAVENEFGWIAHRAFLAGNLAFQCTHLFCWSTCFWN